MNPVIQKPFGSIYQNWCLAKLPEYVFFQEGPGLRNWQWTDDGMKVINVKNILPDGSIDLSNSDRYISLEEFEKRYSHFAVEDRDIVVASSGNTYGKVGRIYRHHLPLMMNTSVIRFHPLSSTSLNPNYLFSFLRSDLFRNQVESFVIGSAQPNFGPSHLKMMEIPVPPLPTQRKIAAVLSTYDDLIENNTRRIEILEEMAQAIYREWFVEFRFPGHEQVPMVDSELGLIPQGWEVKQLGEMCHVIMGLSPKSEFYNETGDGLPFHQGVTDFGKRFPTDRVYCTIQKRIAEADDILFSVRAPVGRINIANKKIVIGRGLSAIRSKSGNQAFLLQQLKDRFQEEDTMGSGAIFNAIRKTDLLEIPLLTPQNQ